MSPMKKDLKNENKINHMVDDYTVEQHEIHT